MINFRPADFIESVQMVDDSIVVEHLIAKIYE